MEQATIKYSCDLPWQHHQTADTLVVYCSAFDFRRYFDEFLDKGLALKAYDLIAVPGGAQIMTSMHFFPKIANFMLRWVEFLVKAHDLHRIVILGHEDCSWYKDFRFGPIHLDLRERQLNDMTEVAAMLRKSLNVQVDLFYARPKAEKMEFVTVS